MTDENNGLLAPVWGALEEIRKDIQKLRATGLGALRLGPGLVLHGDNSQRAAYFSALAKAQAAYAPIERSRTVKVRSDKGDYTFDYAPLEEVISATRPALTANGLAWAAYIADGETGTELHTLLSHLDGGFMHMVETLPRSDKPQAVGSALTYHRRYQYQCLTGTSPEYDDDGNEAAGNQVQTMTQRNRQPPAPATRTAPAVQSGGQAPAQRQQPAPAQAKPAPKPAATAPAQAQRPASVPPPVAAPPKASEPPAAAEEPPPPRDEDAPHEGSVASDGTVLPEPTAADMGADLGSEPAGQGQVDEIIKQAKRLKWDRVLLNKYIADRIDPAKTHTTLTFADAAALIPMLEKQAPNA